VVKLLEAKVLVNKWGGNYNQLRPYDSVEQVAPGAWGDGASSAWLRSPPTAAAGWGRNSNIRDGTIEGGRSELGRPRVRTADLMNKGLRLSVRIEDRVNALLKEGINIYRHALLLTLPDSSLISRGNIRYIGEVKHTADGKHTFKTEDFIEKRTPWPMVAEYEDGYEFIIFANLADEKIDEKLTDNPPKGYSRVTRRDYSLNHPMLRYLLSRKGLREDEIVEMFSEAEKIEEARQRATGRQLKQLSRITPRLEGVFIAIAPNSRIFRSWNMDMQDHFYGIDLQLHRILKNPEGLLVVVYDFFLPHMIYDYNSTVAVDYTAEKPGEITASI